MDNNKQNIELEIKTRLSMFWMFVMFNMIFADVVGFMNPGVMDEIVKGSTPIKITQEILLLFSVLLEIPISMILLSRILKRSVNRWANTLACAVTIPFVISGGSTHLSYLFFASIEVVCMLFIVWYVWKWPNPKDEALRIEHSNTPNKGE